MENFLDKELPNFLYPFVIGGPTFNTEIYRSNSSREVRFTNGLAPVNRYKITNCQISFDQLIELQNFFCAAQGRKNSFRFKDLYDHVAINEPLIMLEKESLTFQLVRSYGIRAETNQHSVLRKILKPDQNSIVIDFNQIKIESFTKKNHGIVQLQRDESLESLNEQSLQSLKASFRFDIPVRFDTDELKYRSELDYRVAVEPFELIEVIQ